MPISYAERKKRRQALLQGLVPELGQRLALRHAEAAAKLSLEAQRTLTTALTAGLRRVPNAIAYLQEQPQATVEDVQRICKGERPVELVPSASRVSRAMEPEDIHLAPLSELAELLQDCFPGMPSMTAEALAADELLSGVLALVRAWQACLCSTPMQSELVFVALCGLALRFLDELNYLMAAHPHYRAALAQSGLHYRMDWAEGQGSQGAREKSDAAPQPPGSQAG